MLARCIVLAFAVAIVGVFSDLATDNGEAGPPQTEIQTEQAELDNTEIVDKLHALRRMIPMLRARYGGGGGQNYNNNNNKGTYNKHRSGSDSHSSNMHEHHEHTYINPGAISFTPTLKSCCKDVLDALDNLEEKVESAFRQIEQISSLFKQNQIKIQNMIALDRRNKAIMQTNYMQLNATGGNVLAQFSILDSIDGLLTDIFNAA